MSSLSPLVFGLPAGSVVDQRQRWSLIITSDAVRAVLLGIIPLVSLAFSIGEIGLLVGVIDDYQVVQHWAK